MQDIKNDSEVLADIDKQLSKLQAETTASVKCMKRAITKSMEFLEGIHFDTAKQIVDNSSDRLQTVCESIENIRKYISHMQVLIEEYSKLTYKG